MLHRKAQEASPPAQVHHLLVWVRLKHLSDAADVDANRVARSEQASCVRCSRRHGTT